MRRMLIIVDMLNDFCKPDGVLATSPVTGKVYAEDTIAPISRILRDFRENGGTVVYVNDAHAIDDKEFDIWPPHAVKGAYGAQIIDELAPVGSTIDRPEYVLEKTRYSGFFGTKLAEIVEELQPEEVVVVGVCTSICVMDTVGGLANRDLNVLIPSDCVADFDPEMHAFSLKRMKNIYQANVLE